MTILSICNRQIIKNVETNPMPHKITESRNVKYLESPPALNAEKITTLNNLKAILIDKTLIIAIARCICFGDCTSNNLMICGANNNNTRKYTCHSKEIIDFFFCIIIIFFT